MTIAYIIILLSTIFLSFFSMMPLWLSLPLFLLSVTGLVIKAVSEIMLQINLKNGKRARKAKWAGQFLYVDGLTFVSNQPVSLFLTRDDVLLVHSAQDDFPLALNAVQNMLVIKGQQLIDLPDDVLFGYLNKPIRLQALNNIRILLERNNALARKQILLISLKDSIENEKLKSLQKNLIIFVMQTRWSSFKQLLNRPEVRTKIRIHHKRMNVPNTQSEGSR